MAVAFEKKVFQHDALCGQQCIAVNTTADQFSLNPELPEGWSCDDEADKYVNATCGNRIFLLSDMDSICGLVFTI